MFSATSLRCSKLLLNPWKVLGQNPVTFQTRICSSTKSTKPVVHPDGLTRWPGINSPQAFLRTADWVGTVSFATSGCFCAGHAGMDLLGCSIVGTITAVGGGTIRDMLLGQFPVFWFAEWEYLLLCLGASVISFFAYDAIDEDGPLLWWTDTIGVGAFSVIGAQNGIRMGMHPIICILCGLSTATFGGAIRDVLCERPVRIFHNMAEIYGTTALTGASCYMLVRQLGGSPASRIAAGIGSAVALRCLAAKEKIALPMAPWCSGPLKIAPRRSPRDY